MDDKLILEIDKKEIQEHFAKGQIERFMKDLNLTYLEAVLYLWFYNHVGISSKDRSVDCGRPMYIKFAKCVSDIVKVKGVLLWQID